MAILHENLVVLTLNKLIGNFGDLSQFYFLFNMSDYEDEFMCDEDEDYDLEYSEDSNSEPDVDLENQYYNSKALKEDNPQAALDSFQRVLELEATNGEKGKN